MGWLLHRLKLALKCCGLLADFLAEFRVRSWGPSLPVPQCQWVRGLGPRAETCFYDSSLWLFGRHSRLAEFMRTDRSWGPSLPVPECQWVRGLGRRDLLL